MQSTSRVAAAFTTLAIAVLLLGVPSAAADETTPGKLQDRVTADRFAAPGLVHDARMTDQQLAAHGAARARRQDRLHVLPGGCEGTIWPQIPLRCLFALGPNRTRPVRTITVETRIGPNTSVLTRVPADIAAR